QLLERHFDLLTRVQREIVNTTFQRHDPTVKQILRRNTLSAEVVDHQRSTIGLHLERRFIKLSVTPGKIGILQSQFAAHDNQRPLDEYPAMVVFNRRYFIGSDAMTV